MKKEFLLYKNSAYDKKAPRYKLLGTYNALLIVSLLLCDVFLFKVVSIFGHPVALSGCIFPFTYLILVCINETYGHKQTAFSLINLIIAQFFFVLGLILLPKIPTPLFNAKINLLYIKVFAKETRAIYSSIVGIAVALYISSVINSKLKLAFWGRYLLLRIIVNAVITKAILCVIIYPINFVGLMPIKDIVHICINTYILKVIFSILIVYFAYPLIWLSRKTDRSDVFDINVRYNPACVYSKQSEGVNMYDQNPC